MTGEKDETEETGDSGGKAPSQLRVVSGPVDTTDAPAPAPAVRLRREFKGLTVADLHRDEIASRLPGQVRSALNHIERGDLDAAERALPGQFAKVLAGPGYRRRYRWRAFAILGVLAVLAGSAIASWLT
ncbi:MAG: hypothetical protein ACI85K_000643 [Hyphomicrobiaceae bacterium]